MSRYIQLLISEDFAERIIPENDVGKRTSKTGFESEITYYEM